MLEMLGQPASRLVVDLVNQALYATPRSHHGLPHVSLGLVTVATIVARLKLADTHMQLGDALDVTVAQFYKGPIGAVNRCECSNTRVDASPLPGLLRDARGVANDGVLGLLLARLVFPSEGTSTTAWNAEVEYTILRHRQATVRRHRDHPFRKVKVSVLDSSGEHPWVDLHLLSLINELDG